MSTTPEADEASMNDDPHGVRRPPGGRRGGRTRTAAGGATGARGSGGEARQGQAEPAARTQWPRRPRPGALWRLGGEGARERLLRAAAGGDVGQIGPFGFSWIVAVSPRKPLTMPIGFAWISLDFSSESKLINGLHGIFAGRIFLAACPWPVGLTLHCQSRAVSARNVAAHPFDQVLHRRQS